MTATPAINDTLYVRGDGRAYMEVRITEIEGGQIYGDVTWATILALTYRCAMAAVVRQGDRWVCDHGMGERANINAPRYVEARGE